MVEMKLSASDKLPKELIPVNAPVSIVEIDSVGSVSVTTLPRPANELLWREEIGLFWRSKVSSDERPEKA